MEGIIVFKSRRGIFLYIKLSCTNKVQGKVIHMATKKDFIDIIASKMELMNLTQTELAKRIPGVSRRAISSYMCKISEPSLETLAKICEICELDFNHVFKLVENDQCINELFLKSDEMKLIKYYRDLNEEGKEKFLEVAASLNKILK